MRRFLILGTVLALSGCGGGGHDVTAPPLPPQPSMSGTWKGTFVDPAVSSVLILTVTIADDTVTHNVTGAAQLSTSLGPLFGLTASGVFVAPMATVTLSEVGQPPAQLAGAISGNSWTAICER